MAETDAKPQTTSEMVGGRREEKLRYLEFINVAAIYLMVCFSMVYEFAKDNAGPLKPGVDNVEATAKTVIGPVFHKFAALPFQLLRFADLKVEELAREMEKQVPWVVKQASTQAQALASEVQRSGVVETAKNVATAVYERYEPVVVWRWLNRVPLFPEMLHIAVPTAAYWARKYNEGVYYAADRGYSVAAHLPYIPLHKLSKLFDDDLDSDSTTTLSNTASEPPALVQ